MPSHPASNEPLRRETDVAIAVVTGALEQARRRAGASAEAWADGLEWAHLPPDRRRLRAVEDHPA